MEDAKRFVGLDRPREVRVYNLTAVKEVINADKSYFKLKILRDQKLKLVSNTKKEIKEIQVLFNKLYEILPEHEILELAKRIKQKENSSSKKKSSKKPQKRATKHSAATELERLESSLAMIEDKLKNI